MNIKHMLVPVTLNVTILSDEGEDKNTVEAVREELERVNNRLADKDFPTYIINTAVEAKGIYELGGKS